MEIGCSTWSLGPEMDPMDKLQCIQKAGIELVEVWDRDFSLDSDPATVRGQWKEHGLTFYSFHTTVGLGPEDPDERQKAHDTLLREIEFVARCGGKILVVHAADNNDYNKAAMDRALPLAAREGVLLCVENGRPETVDHLEALIIHYNDDHLGFILDTGHLFFDNMEKGNDTLSEVVHRMAPYLHHIHCQDMDRTQRDHEAVGKGGIDWNRFVADLSEVGYSECLMIEVQRQDYNDNMVYSRDTLAAAMKAAGVNG